MLLLLRSPAGTVSASLGIAMGLSGIAGPAATVGVALGFTPPTTIELNVFALPDLKLGLLGISSGFVSRSATLDTKMTLVKPNVLTFPPDGGFTDSPVLSLQLGLTGTRGSFLDGSGTVGITQGLSGSLLAVPTASVGAVLNISGAVTISGGTLNPSSSVGMSLSINPNNAQFAGFVTADMQLNLNGVPTLYDKAAAFPTGPYIDGIGPWLTVVKDYG